ncbi:MAG: efflux RND transporter periplasmic adaptor subunit [Lysobacterales bacterium]|nr:efflux RND transporter periplasmic adaptor subunit [Xanthomonadales bacterium]MCB1613769.1 efflux RND transporter periplasmic adaptor subunit [Xanthomonadales bacterium]
MRSPAARAGLLLAAALVVAVLYFGFRGERVRVDTAQVQRQELVESLREEGRTRVVHRYRITAAVAGEVERLEWRPGDPVSAGQVLVRIAPAMGALLDPATRERLQFESRAAGSAVSQAQARINAAKAADTLAQQELQRVLPMVASGTLAQREGDRAQSQAQQARAELAAARFTLQLAQAQQEAAQALLQQQGASAGDDTLVEITAPVAGVILARLRESAGPVAVGEPLLEIGDPTSLEVEVDLLSSDAVRVAPGMDVRLHRWGGEQSLQARVRRVEPVGFTKISALGVEEQRVYVLADLVSPAEQWQRLGDGYRVDAEFILSSGEALTVPGGALFRSGQDWALFRIEDGRAHLRKVELGRRSGLEAEILSGVEAGDLIVVHPDDRVSEGARVEPL